MSNRVPDSFLRHLAAHVEDEDELNRLRETCGRPLPTTLRLLPREGVSIDPAACIRDTGARLTELPFARDGHRIDDAAVPPGATLEHALGLWYVQEAASMISGEALIRTAPKDSRLVLDLCAAPGSKTTQLARAFSAKATVVANEPATSRLKSLVANLIRTGSDAIVTSRDGRELGPQLAARCDAVLVDAPCSGEGTVRRDPKALRGWNRKRQRKFAGPQRDLLRAGAEALRPGGTLIYSTCALSPEENQDIVRGFLDERDDFEGLDLSTHFPELALSHYQGQLWVMPQHYDTGGFFVAALRRRTTAEATTSSLDSDRESKSQAAIATSPEDEALALLLDRYGVSTEVVRDWTVRKRGDALVGLRTLDRDLVDVLDANRPGPRLAERKGDVWHPTQEFLLRFAPWMKREVRDIDRDLARRLLLGNAPPEDFAPEPDAHPLALRYCGAGIAFSGRRGPRPISLLPRAWILPRVD